jgi:hypothetical protein
LSRLPGPRSLAGVNAARSTSTWPKIAMAMKARMKAVTSDWIIMVPSESTSQPFVQQRADQVHGIAQ